jgi:hypothetical protein
MKTTQFNSREAVLQALAAFGAILSFAVAGIFSAFFMSDPPDDALLILPAISVGLALFVWAFFRLVRPFHAGHSWQIAELVLVPLYWFPIFLAVAAWIGWLNRTQDLHVIFTDLLY